MTAATFSDAVHYIANVAGVGDLDLFADAAQQRQSALAQERMEALTKGQDVRLDQLKDRELNGLTGRIHSVDRASSCAVVVFDEGSLWSLRRHHKYGSRIPAGATSFTITVPLACVFPR